MMYCIVIDIRTIYYRLLILCYVILNSSVVSHGQKRNQSRHVIVNATLRVS